MVMNDRERFPQGVVLDDERVDFGFQFLYTPFQVVQCPSPRDSGRWEGPALSEPKTVRTACDSASTNDSATPLK